MQDVTWARMFTRSSKYLDLLVWLCGTASHAKAWTRSNACVYIYIYIQYVYIDINIVPIVPWFKYIYIWRSQNSGALSCMCWRWPSATFFEQPLDGALCSGWDVCSKFRAEGVLLGSGYYDRESDLYWGLVLYLLSRFVLGPCLVFVEGGLRPPFFNQPLDGALCCGWGICFQFWVFNFGLMVYDSVRNITIGNLICIGAESCIFCTYLYWGLVLYFLKVAFGHIF